MLAQLSSLKSRLRLESFDVADDTLLTNYLKHASGRFAQECNRIFDRAVGATFEYHAHEREITPDRYPIESVTGFDLKSNETEGWVPQSDIDYVISPEKCLIELATSLGHSRQIARVTFSGGYVVPGGTVGAGQTALPDELEQACIDQVVYWYQNRQRLGLLSTSGEGGSAQQMKTLDLLPHVAAVLKKYERWVN
jgi:hypothetical protein